VPELWLPGHDGPHVDFVARLHREIERFAKERELERAHVEIELRDGSRFGVEAVSPDPGYGFITLTPEEGEEDAPERLVVPVASIARVELRRAEEVEGRPGFALPAAPPVDESAKTASSRRPSRGGRGRAR
jgi:hypothetical protein